jgi:D-3-phosphoglycerate dehydrogenase / 2-oxoglutarate reductase
LVEKRYNFLKGARPSAVSQKYSGKLGTMSKHIILNTLDLTNCPQAIKDLEAVGRVIHADPKLCAVKDILPEVTAYLASASLIVDRDFLSVARKLRVIGSPSTGTDHLDLDAINARGIAVFDISKEYDLLSKFTATSELAFGLLLAVIRNIPLGREKVLHGEWEREKLKGFQLAGKTIGIIGVGRLGSITAKIAHGFDMQILGFDPFKKGNELVEYVEIDVLLKSSDVVFIHVHLNSDTVRLVGKSEFELMKPSSIIVNTSRGKIIDEDALLDALENEKIAGAALDVIDGEWLSREKLLEHKLVNYAQHSNNLLIVPHIGGSTDESIILARNFMAKKVSDYLKSAEIGAL